MREVARIAGVGNIIKRDYEEAIRCYREILEFDPSSFRAFAAIGRALGLQGNYTEALAMLEKARSMEERVPSILAAMGQIFGLSGDRASAQGVLARLEASPASGTYRRRALP